ncbi:uncharacterized protein METZ01_LOCUS281646, partial [marine metagenome]
PASPRSRSACCGRANSRGCSSRSSRASNGTLGISSKCSTTRRSRAAKPP